MLVHSTAFSKACVENWPPNLEVVICAIAEWETKWIGFPWFPLQTKQNKMGDHQEHNWNTASSLRSPPMATLSRRRWRVRPGRCGHELGDTLSQPVNVAFWLAQTCPSNVFDGPCFLCLRFFKTRIKFFPSKKTTQGSEVTLMRSSK